MFGFAWSEILLIGAVALVVIGPKDLPRVMRTAGQWSRKLRVLAGDPDVIGPSDLPPVYPEQLAQFDVAVDQRRWGANDD